MAPPVTTPISDDTSADTPGSSDDRAPDGGADLRRSIARVHDMQYQGRSAESVDIADRLIPALTDPYQRADVLICRLGALINLERAPELATAIDTTFEAVRSHALPTLYGRLYALAANANLLISLERAVTHMVHASRALNAAEGDSLDAGKGWRSLAITYSLAGFHGHALSAIEKACEVVVAAGYDREVVDAPDVRLRLALSLDHGGDTDGCLRVLNDIVAELDRHHSDRSWLARLRPLSRGWFGYAIARRAALGERSDTHPQPLIDRCGDSKCARDIRLLGAVALDIAGGRPREALTRLENATIAGDTLHAAEVPRLRALAYLQMDDHSAAYAADRHTIRLATATSERIRDLFIDGVAARLDHEDLRRTVARYADEALTDPLTGLPNRRYLEQHVADMMRRGERAVLGVCDMDGFKAVNTAHGHLSGDLVLQRVAGVINRVMRRNDFVARYGGDEFVVVLPATEMPGAEEIGRRISSAVLAEDWEALVPGTPVGVSVGWAELDGQVAVASAFEAADLAMMTAKAARKRVS